MFSREFREIFKNSFLTEHIRETASWVKIVENQFTFVSFPKTQ